VVERVVLFKMDHAARGLVAAVDTVTAPGYTPNLSPWQRPGRITGLITPKCVFNFSPPRLPQLSSLHPGVSLEEVRRLTGFTFEAPAGLPETQALDAETRSLLYGPVKEKLAQAYPHFAARLQNI
jgi:glutaconate CoA-transferase subunit B